MKIQQTQLKLNSQRQNCNKQDLSFTGGETGTLILNFFDTNQTIGAIAVDVGCMGTPRTAVEFKKRSPASGFETMRREFSSTINDGSLGLYGFGASWLFAGAFNKQFDIKAHKMFISDDMLYIFSDIWDDSKNIDTWLKDVIKNYKGFNPGMSGCDANGHVSIDETTQKQVFSKYKELITNTDELNKEPKAFLKALIVDATGSEKNFKLERVIEGKIVQSITSLDDLLENTFKMAKNFMNNNVSETFKNGNLADNIFIKGFKNLNRNKTILGLVASMAVGLSVQPLNNYLTKKKTGKSGFVGVEGQEPNKSIGFTLLKLGIASLWMLFALRTIGKSPKEIFKKIQFKGFLPTMDQFKLVYGTTIASRIIIGRDENELRETSFKDPLGFMNWLIFGGSVSKLTAAGFEKMSKFKNGDFIRYNEIENGKGWFNWLTKSSIVSREEVLHSAFKEIGISSIECGFPMKMRQMIKTLKRVAKNGAPEAAANAVKALSKIRYLGVIQCAGYLYSGLVLGIGIPKLNIAITKAFQNRHKQELEKEKAAA